MEYRVLGRSGLRVSEISLACWAIGGPSWRNGSPVGWSGSDDAASFALSAEDVQFVISTLCQK